MLKKIDITTIIPFYNGSKYIERAIMSVLSQTLKSMELIIVDDGSKPSEEAVLQHLQKKYGFTYYKKQNGGQGSARNFGALKASTRFIAFLDQDDYYLPRHNEILAEGVDFLNPKFGWVYGDLWHADEAGSVISLSILSDTRCEHPKKNIKEMLSNDLFILPSASLISLCAFKDVGGFDEQFMGYEDDDLFLRLFRQGWSNHFINEPVTAWCINEHSTSYSYKMAVSRNKYFKKLLANFPDSIFNGIYYSRDLIIPRFVQMTLSEMIKYCKNPDSNTHIYIDVLREFISILKNANADRTDVITEINTIISHLSVFSKSTKEKVGPELGSSKKTLLSYKDVVINGEIVKMIDIKKMRQIFI